VGIVHKVEVLEKAVDREISIIVDLIGTHVDQITIT
jgi:hypothetical protein